MFYIYCKNTVREVNMNKKVIYRGEKVIYTYRGEKILYRGEGKNVHYIYGKK